MQTTDIPQEKLYLMDCNLDNNCKETVPQMLIVSENCFFPFSFSMLFGDDNQKENYRPLGALPVFSWRRRNRLSVRLLSLWPTAGAKGGF